MTTRLKRVTEAGAAMSELVMLAPVILILGTIFASTSGLYEFLSSSSIKEYQALQEVPVSEHSEFLSISPTGGLEPTDTVTYLAKIYDSLVTSQYVTGQTTA